MCYIVGYILSLERGEININEFNIFHIKVIFASVIY